jgi:hypothetical protein
MRTIAVQYKVKEVPAMKKLLSIAAGTVFALSLGLAYADEMPGSIEESKDLGITLSEEAAATHEVNMKEAKGAAAGGLGAEKAVAKDGIDTSFLGPGGSDLP